ncbi:MAG: hypothetical protein ACMG6S_08700 [Byssovorax sp.]
MTRNRRTKILAVTAALLTVSLVVVAQGCGVSDGPTLYGCDHPLEGRIAKNGEPDGCCDVDPCPGHCIDDPCPTGDAGTDATTAEAGGCSGTCAPLLPFGGWEGPALLWLGPEGMEPACPAQAPVIAYQGHDGLNALPASCGTCICSSPSGTCAPPLSLTASAKPCNSTGAITSPFNGPAAWDGACTAQDCISPNPSCSQSLSVQSLTAAPLAMTEQGCTPSIIVPQNLSTPTWTTAALACRGMVTSGPGCSDPGQTCVPSAVPPDFSMCIYHEADVSCPDSYPQKHLVYAGFDDQRACSDCACSAPVGSACTAALSVFKDGACSVPLLSAPISSSGSACFDLVPAGLPLGSKTVTALAYEAGTCMASGGEASGSLAASGPSTFCCLMG